MKIDRPVSKQPLPAHAKSVFKGKIFEVYQWEQELFDGTTTLFEKVKRPDAVSIIPITVEKKILLTQQNQPGLTTNFMATVGGIVDQGEDLLLAAERELLEETGYKAENFKLWYAHNITSKIDWVNFMFIAKNCQKMTDQKLDAGEQIEVIEVSFDEFFEIATQDNFRDKELSLRLLREYFQDPKLSNTKSILGI